MYDGSFAGIALLFFWLMKVLCFSIGKQGNMKTSEDQHSVSESGGMRNYYFKQTSVVSGMYCKH